MCSPRFTRLCNQLTSVCAVSPHWSSAVVCPPHFSTSSASAILACSCSSLSIYSGKTVVTSHHNTCRHSHQRCYQLETLSYWQCQSGCKPDTTKLHPDCAHTTIFQLCTYALYQGYSLTVCMCELSVSRWHPRGVLIHLGCHLETLVPLGVFTQKLVPNWISWNRFTEIGLDDSLTFTLII